MPRPVLYLILAEIALAFLFNILNPRLPKIPGDIYFDKSGFRLYIPFVSALVLSIILYLLGNQFIH